MPPATANAPAAKSATTAKPPVVPAKPPLEDTIARLAVTRQADTETALKVWRTHAATLAAGKHLSEAEVLALSECMRILSLTPDDLTHDVKAIVAHQTQIAGIATTSKLIDEMTAEQASWNDEEVSLHKRLNEIKANRARLMSATAVLASHQQEVGELVSANHRVLAPLDVAVSKTLAGASYTPKVISSRDEFRKIQDIPASRE